MLAYREAPSQAEVERLWVAFDKVFEPSRGYQQLDACLAQTRAKKDEWLMDDLDVSEAPSPRIIEMILYHLSSIKQRSPNVREIPFYISRNIAHPEKRE